MEIFFALLLVVVVVGLIAWFFYNKIIKLKVRVNEGWSDINVQLKRRHSLISNLVETVKGYATHEKDTLEKVVQARQAAADAEGKDAVTLAGAERMLSTAMQGLNINALAEAYPDLKANTNFLQLQAELADTENKIAASRRFYNTTVTSLNTTIQQFPGNLIKGLAKAEKAEFFEIEEDQAVKEVPKVDFHKDTVAAQAAAAPAASSGVATPPSGAATAPAAGKAPDAPAAGPASGGPTADGMPAMTTPPTPPTAKDQTTSSSDTPAPTQAPAAPAPTPKIKEEAKPAPAAPASGGPEPAKEEPKTEEAKPKPTPEPKAEEPKPEEPK